MWDVTETNDIMYRKIKISTHTSRVGCDDLVNTLQKMKMISTHTSRVGCDDLIIILKYRIVISTHTSRVGCDVP